MPSASESRGGPAPIDRWWITPAAIVGFTIVLALYPVFVTNSYLRYLGVLTIMYMGMATAWNLMGGFTGYISLGHSAFFGIGAYATGLLVTRVGWPNLAVVVLGGLVVGVLAAAVGYVALRVRGASFVIVTIALVYITNLIAQGWRGLTGGSSGLTVPSGFGGVSRAVLHQRYYWLFLVVLTAVLLLWWFVDRSKFGMGLKAIREDEDKALALGVSANAFKIVAFALSGGLVGVSGGLYASWFGFLDPIFAFSILIGANLVLMSLLGGIRNLWGPVLGAGILVPATDYFLVQLGESQAHLVATGLLLGAVVLLMPEGIIPSVLDRLGPRRGGQASIREAEPEPTARTEPSKAA